MTSACATGCHAIGEAWKSIKFSDADVMIAGGSESAVTRLSFAAFGKMRALSQRNHDPEGASRPFDADRDGFVMGEGAGVVVLEEYEHARKRGADILCELIGYGLSADAYHPTMPHPEGRGASQCMERALKRARLNASDIDYINAHGTATPRGDVIETKAIKKILRRSCAERPAHQFHQIDDGALVRGGWRCRIGRQRVGDSAPSGATNNQLGDSGSGVRFGLCRQRSARSENRHGVEQFVRVWRDQRDTDRDQM